MSAINLNDIGRMRCPLIATVLLIGVAQAPNLALAQTLPMPRRVIDDDGDSFSTAEFERILHKLKAEREGLNADWQALHKRNTSVEPSLDMEQKLFEQRMQKALEDLRQRRSANGGSPRPVAPTAEPPKIGPEPLPAPKDEKKSELLPPPAQRGEKEPGPIDALGQAHALMRSRQYGEALAAFHQVDLKLMKSNERAPVQYLKACCCLHLGKSKEAGELLQEVANYRGDEKLAGYAQSQLELLRWQRDISQKLQDIRQRHRAMEPAQ
jgi:hypothetical protein